LAFSKLFQDDIGVVISVDVGEDLSKATSYIFHITKPDGIKTDWIPVVGGDSPVDGILEYSIVVGDLNLPGIYRLESEVLFAGKRLVGSKVVFKVWESLWRFAEVAAPAHAPSLQLVTGGYLSLTSGGTVLL